MTHIHHLNCVEIESPSNGRAIGHCLLLEESGRLILVDAGIGLKDTNQPEQRLGTDLIKMVGFKLDESRTAFRQIEKLGFDPAAVTDCIASHLDPDHIGGLADFPKATLHVAREEYENFRSSNPRYLPHQLEPKPQVALYEPSPHEWLGFEARKIELDTEAEIYLIPLPGHTHGHCGIAMGIRNEWIFYVGDAYYLRAELTEIAHPVDAFAAMRSDDNDLRLETLQRLRTFAEEYPEVMMFGYHDPLEFPVPNLIRGKQSHSKANNTTV